MITAQALRSDCAVNTLPRQLHQSREEITTHAAGSPVMMLARRRCSSTDRTYVAPATVFTECLRATHAARVLTFAMFAPTAVSGVFGGTCTRPRMIGVAGSWVGELPGSILRGPLTRVSSARRTGLHSFAQAVSTEVFGAMPAVAARAGKYCVGAHLY